jgi:hypothetical protein
MFTVDAATGCHVWIRGKTSEGYGTIAVNGRSILAHRWFYAVATGTWPAALDHRCRNKACVNAAHLRPATAAQNQQNVVARSGLRGVVASGNRWVAQAKLNGRHHYLGSFGTEAEAGAVAAAWRAEHMPFSPDAEARAA